MPNLVREIARSPMPRARRRVPQSTAELLRDLTEQELAAEPLGGDEADAWLAMTDETFRLSVLAELRSLRFNETRLANRVTKLYQLWDVWLSPWWRVGLFVVDGWPLRSVVRRPQWRPWRRWWTS